MSVVVVEKVAVAVLFADTAAAVAVTAAVAVATAVTVAVTAFFAKATIDFFMGLFWKELREGIFLEC